MIDYVNYEVVYLEGRIETLSGTNFDTSYYTKAQNSFLF